MSGGGQFHIGGGGGWKSGVAGAFLALSIEIAGAFVGCSAGAVIVLALEEAGIVLALILQRVAVFYILRMLITRQEVTGMQSVAAKAAATVWITFTVLALILIARIF